MTTVSRRGFLAASSAVFGAACLPRAGIAQASAPLRLSATTRTLDIDGRAATVLGLSGPSGQGLILNPGQRFRVDLANDLDVDTIIHWHGQIPPNVQDGVPDMPLPLLAPGETRPYDFEARPGTHWMHSHVPVQEMSLLAAPLIVRRPEDLAADRQEVVMFLHDFSFRPAAEVLAEITANMTGHDMEAMGGEGSGGSMSGMDHGGMSMGDMQMDGMAMDGMAMDLNDFDFDAYLANDRTLSDPEIVPVERGGRVLLRVINAAAATSFWIDAGEVPARLVATDGHAVEPVSGRRFGLAMGQRLDIELDLPGAGAFPVFALREGARERTGLILATPGAAVATIGSLGDAKTPAFDTDLAQEFMLKAAAAPLPPRPVDRRHMVMLQGAMMPYRWTIDGRSWGNHKPLEARSGERVEFTFHNMSMMGHPMHLHGHVFQVVNVNGRAIRGALRDTVYIPPMAMVTVALDAGEAARWMLHCHHIPHLATGMMSEFAISA
ncbi:multicopper oxidase family protein [Loktanella sp. DJP18]|uniref:multicopper oxidase family protein n=1 Tax=Loktanella sp. DJP18 TaxID=3409788 RepID=UPI003BB5BF33